MRKTAAISVLLFPACASPHRRAAFTPEQVCISGEEKLADSHPVLKSRHDAGCIREFWVFNGTPRVGNFNEATLGFV